MKRRILFKKNPMAFRDQNVPFQSKARALVSKKLSNATTN